MSGKDLRELYERYTGRQRILTTLGVVMIVTAVFHFAVTRLAPSHQPPPPQARFLIEHATALEVGQFVVGCLFIGFNAWRRAKDR